MQGVSLSGNQVIGEETLVASDGLFPVTRTPAPLITCVSSLSLTHFRCYESARIEVDVVPIVLTGRNGAGKTNILEALSLLTPGRGLRRAKLSEMDNSSYSHAWAIAAGAHGRHGVVKIGTARDDASEIDKRLVKIDGKQQSNTALGSHLAMLWVTPQTEQLFQESASGARKFLDRLVYSFDAEHASRVNEYEYAMRERNKLLETGSGDSFWLDSLEQNMTEMACAIASARLEAVSGLNQAIQSSTLSFPKAHMAVNGFMEDMLAAGERALTAEGVFKAELARARARDAAAGRALTGAHRSELKVRHIEKQMPAEACSTGEQKALLLSIVLAQARFSALKKGIVPILLLDEVAAHLDSIRRLELFEEICQIGAQSWMTGTDPVLFSDLKGKVQYFQVENGTVFPASS